MTLKDLLENSPDSKMQTDVLHKIMEEKFGYKPGKPQLKNDLKAIGAVSDDRSKTYYLKTQEEVE